MYRELKSIKLKEKITIPITDSFFTSSNFAHVHSDSQEIRGILLPVRLKWTG